MPHGVRKGRGKRPYKIVNKNTGRVKGSSTSRRKAEISASIRDRSSGHRKRK